MAISDYSNPLRHVSNLVPERIDQGVDYSGTGPVYAIGPGVVTMVAGASSSGWGGPYIQYRLTAGPYAGKLVYFAEGVTPSVRPGEHVTSGTVIGHMSGGIETGFASGVGTESEARKQGQTPGTGDAGSVSTAFGKLFNSLLVDIGAPSGRSQGRTSGTIPKGWATPSSSPSPSGGSTPAQTVGSPNIWKQLFWNEPGEPGWIIGEIGRVGNASGITNTGGAIEDFVNGIASFITDLKTVMTYVHYLFEPSSWLRVLSGVGGAVLFVVGVVMLWRAIGGQTPQPIIPMPIPV